MSSSGLQPRFGNTDVSRETYGRLIELRELVRRWNGTIQLVSARDVAMLDQRHFANSLSLLPLLQELRPKSIIDVGSGGGFPGLVVAIATGIHTQLIEADRRKATFLQEAVRLLQVDAVVHARRVEAVSATAEVVTARAFAPLHRLWPVASRLLAPCGRGLFLCGPQTAENAVAMDQRGLFWTFPDGTIFEVAGS